ncbi:leucyl/phenylalanyl-tRNA--protein transferase [Maribacter orientalis]|uniref:Leucyl/phenylalanyl-tRNA--protein transferase n=2 Tax=Maribacter orientalis TaxID=228957 RepID=A0A1H7KL14_9FLAO|nr:leucyl/phenylalanyl-tRNA--protein transferase [Maribacter orientalis]|tara:strand:- start:1088 stop:1792 length:705 start_codon:yes stop_codon:yes gene_type:complete
MVKQVFCFYELLFNLKKMEKSQHRLFFLTDELGFPPVDTANSDGLLAVGGDLSPERLLLAYHQGIFPWFNEDSIILWWSPDPRMVLYPRQIKISKSMGKVLRDNRFRLTKNTCFKEVLEYCSSVDRPGQDGTWITEQMKKAYLQLHEKGIAKSYEAWEGDKLVGGLYGVDLGHVFCGESMFSLTSNASKFVFIKLAQELQEQGYKIIDCQLHTDHLESLGAQEISRKEFLKLLK